MRWIKGIFIFLITVFVAGGIFSLWRVLRVPEKFQEAFVAEIEDSLEGQFSFQNSKIIFAPLPRLWMERPALGSLTEGFPAIGADEIHFSLRLWPLVWGKFEISGIEIRNGIGNFWGIPLQGIDFKLRGLGPGKMASFECRAHGIQGKGTLRGKGGMSFHKAARDLWEGLSLKGDVTLNQLFLSGESGENFLRPFPPLRVSGELSGKLHLAKEEGKKVIQGDTHFELKDFQFQDSLPFLLTGEAGLLWEKGTDSLEARQVSIKTPFGELEGGGVVNLETGEIGEFRLNGRAVVLEEVVRHFPNLGPLLPLDTGFSGESEFDLMLRGTWDYLTLNTHWNLTSVVLTYGKIFSKPKDFPMALQGDLLLKGASQLSGDFSIRIRETVAKGAIVGLDLKTGLGEFTLLTNKFDLMGWETLLTPFAGYEISGPAKVFLNWKGDFDEPAKAETMLNLTLEKATFLSPERWGIREANVLLDTSPLGLSVKNTSFEIGTSPVQLQAEIYNLRENPQGFVRISSPQLEPFTLLENLRAFASLFLSEKYPVPWAGIEEGMGRFFPKPLLLEELTLDLKAKQGKLLLENLAFQALDGNFLFQGEMDWPSPKPRFWLHAEMERVSLARYFEGLHLAEKILEGNLFFKGKFQGEGVKPEEISESLSGEGGLAVTNGEWHSLDLLGPLNSLEPFRGKGEASPSLLPVGSSTPFHDLKVSWKYLQGKFDTRDFLLHSEPLWVEGEGNLSGDGIFNSRLEVYLSPSLTEQALRSWGAREKGEGKLLGPIPLIWVGSFTRPEVRADERSLGAFLEAVRARRFRKILRPPLRGKA